MKRLTQFAMALLAAGMLLATEAPAQGFGRGGGRDGFLVAQRRGGGGPHAGRERRPGPHMGQWLSKHKDLPPEEQERALSNDPEFRKLPAERQERLRERLRHFNSLPPEKRQQILQRMDAFGHLTPEQQERARGVFRQLRQMPRERRRAVFQALRRMRDLGPEERQQMLASEEFRERFNDEERGLISEALQSGLVPGRPAEEKPGDEQ